MNVVPVPEELKLYAKYYYAAESLLKYNPIVAQVLRHVFVDYCLDDIIPFTTAQRAHEFVQSYKKNLSSFPCDGPSETRYFANELYDSLISFLKSGKVGYKVAEQFWLCSIVFSVLDGEDAIHKEKTCRIAAARILRALNNARKSEPKPAKQSQKTDADNDFPNFDALRLVQSLRTTDSGSLRSQQTEPAKPTKPDFKLGYDDQAAVAFLASMGIKIESQIPPVKDAFKGQIAERLDMALTMSHMSNNESALRNLEEAAKLWKIGRV